MKQRSYYLDNVCCLLILYMIYINHVAAACGYNSSVVKFIGTSLSFFMSWFFFKGGMLHKKVSTKELIRKSTKRLLVPYLIFLLFGFFLDVIVRTINDESLKIILIKDAFFFAKSAIVTSTAASWFLLSLFVVRLLFNFFENKALCFFLTGILLFAAYGIYVIQSYVGLFYMQYEGYKEPCFIPDWIGNICHGLLAYTLGFCLKEKQFENKMFILALLLFALKYIIPAEIDFRTNISTGVHYLLAVIYGISGCIVVNNLFRRYVDVKIKMFTYIGYNSMLYYLIHYPVIYTTTKLFSSYVKEYDIQIRYYLLSLIVTISMVIAEFIFRNKRIRFIIGG